MSTEIDILTKSIDRLEKKYDSGTKDHTELEILVRTHLAENSAEKIKELEGRVKNVEDAQNLYSEIKKKRSLLIQERGTILGALAVIVMLLEKVWPVIERIFLK